MTFTPGHTLSTGRPPGSLNRRSQQVIDVLERECFCPASKFIDLYGIALAKFTEEVAKEDSGRISPMESSAAKYLKIACDQVAHLATYAYPRLKTIEQVQASPLEGMNVQDKLEALKQAVRALEAQARTADHGPEVP